MERKKSECNFLGFQRRLELVGRTFLKLKTKNKKKAAESKFFDEPVKRFESESVVVQVSFRKQFFFLLRTLSQICQFEALVRFDIWATAPVEQLSCSHAPVEHPPDGVLLLAAANHLQLQQEGQVVGRLPGLFRARVRFWGPSDSCFFLHFVFLLCLFCLKVLSSTYDLIRLIVSVRWIY